MALGSFSRGALAELQRDDLARMLELDESLFVEHKSDLGPSSHGLAKTVASFANTLGGWLLIGVYEGKPRAGETTWGADGAPTLIDALRDRLRTELDPLPAFEARVVQLEDGPVGVVRVYESSDTPHVTVATGSVFVREVAGTADAAEPRRPGARARGERAYRAAQIRSRAQLVELSERGERAAARVDELLDPARPQPLVRDRLGLGFTRVTEHDWQPAASNFGSIIARLVPYTLPARFRGWATTADSMAAVLRAGENLALRSGLANNWAVPHPAGVSVRISLEAGARHRDGARLGLGADACVLADGAGIAGAALHLERPDTNRRAWTSLGDICDNLIEPVVRAAVAVLEDGEFLGRVRCQIDAAFLGTAIFVEGTEQIAGHVPVTSDLTLPATDADIAALVELAANAIGRSGGLPTFDPAPGPH